MSMQDEKSNIQQTIITNGCLQILYVNGVGDDDSSIKAYTEYLDVFLIFQGDVEIKIFNKKKNLTEGDLFFCTHSSYLEVFHGEKPFSYARIRFLKDKLGGMAPLKRFAASLLGSDIIKEKVFNHCLSFISFLETSTEQLSESEAEAIHNENMEILSVLEILIAQEHENLQIISADVSSNPLIIKAVDFFEENLETNLKVNHFTEQLDVSHSYFIRVFKKGLGVVPNVFWRTMKLNHSLSLLSLSMDSLSEISYLLGFSDQSHFTNSFKKFLHSTPGSMA